MGLALQCAVGAAAIAVFVVVSVLVRRARHSYRSSNGRRSSAASAQFRAYRRAAPTDRRRLPLRPRRSRRAWDHRHARGALRRANVGRIGTTAQVGLCAGRTPSRPINAVHDRPCVSGRISLAAERLCTGPPSARRRRDVGTHAGADEGPQGALARQPPDSRQAAACRGRPFPVSRRPLPRLRSSS